MSIATAFLALSAAFYLVGKLQSHRQPDYRQREPEGQTLSEEQGDPLLAEDGI